MIALGNDHAGLPLKQDIMAYLDQQGVAYKDFGTFTQEACSWSDMAVAPCRAVAAGECECALLFCGTGIGISIAANKIPGIRAAACSDYFSAKHTRLHNNANALCLGARVVGPGLARELVQVFLETPFEGGRHAVRTARLSELERGEYGIH